jgi:hypothetical protein
MWYSNLDKKQLFLDISSSKTDTLAPSLYRCVETRSIEIYSLLSQSLPHLVGHHPRLSNVLERIPRSSCELLYATNISHRKQETFLCEYPFAHKKTHNRALLFGSTLLRHSRHFYYWNQPLIRRMRVCYPDFHEGRLCCYLVILIGNLLHPLQLFHFHFWPTYWLSLAVSNGLQASDVRPLPDWWLQIWLHTVSPAWTPW